MLTEGVKLAIRTKAKQCASQFDDAASRRQELKEEFKALKYVLASWSQYIIATCFATESIQKIVLS